MTPFDLWSPATNFPNPLFLLELGSRDRLDCFPDAIGQAWLWKAQPTLARIHEREARSPSSSGSGRRSGSDYRNSNGEYDSEPAQIEADTEADARVGSPEYIEARTILQPATEYLDRAVTAMNQQRIQDGSLLTLVSLFYFMPM